MKTFNRFIQNSSLVVLFFCCISCIEKYDVMYDDMENETSNTCVGQFNISYAEFDMPETRNATSTSWKSGDKVYLTFGDNAYGMATYKSDQWTVEYFGNLTKNKKKNCKVVYFENPKSTEAFQAVNLTHETGIYEDTLAYYQYDGTILNITASLHPKTGRMRFKGTYKDTVRVYGLTYGTKYTVYKGEYEDTLQFVELIAKSDGYTPYIYGEFADSTARRLNVVTSKNAFSREFADSIMTKGQSGWLTIPTNESHPAWINKLIFKVKTIEFAMMPVVKNEYLSFLIGETEVTQGLYNVLSSTEYTISNYPKIFSSYDACESFIKLINSGTGINFSLPTTTQWEFAYKGGEKSQNYTYSGSNTASEVAWYSVNSESKAHEVATLMPNELGIYDMSGNLSEWTCTDFVYKYNNNNYYKYTKYYYCNSCYISNSAGWSKDHDKSNSSSNNANYTGIRLALSFK